MGADNLVENTLKCPRIYLPDLSAQAQMLDFHELHLRVHIQSSKNNGKNYMSETAVLQTYKL